ncbi:MAG TPA: hypothetical protein ENN81_00175 [Phycisphaerales bacterium]|nr:hypothetical protein [Phycisphaerales bacterium]
MAKDEQVLVIKRQIIEEAGMFHGLQFDVAPYLDRIFAPGALTFMPRPQAETDPTHKQLIPYVIITHAGRVLSYVRGKRAGETRLVGNRSIGIGGHINPIDNEVPLFDADYRELYRSAVEREVAEEIQIDATHTERIVALLNDDSNEVGRVHIGVVHLWTVDSDAVARREQMITQMAFHDLAEIQQLRPTMETWSQLCLDALDRII